MRPQGPCWQALRRPPAMMGPLRAHQCRHAHCGHVQVDHCQRREGAIGVLGQPATAHLGENPQALEDLKRVLDPRTVAAFGAVALISVSLEPCATIGGRRCGMGPVRGRKVHKGSILAASVLERPAPVVRMARSGQAPKMVGPLRRLRGCRRFWVRIFRSPPARYVTRGALPECQAASTPWATAGRRDRPPSSPPPSAAPGWPPPQPPAASAAPATASTPR